ncbi:HAMP domain-containing protein [Paenibacillus sp. LMG 31456]|uniref:HAMP domain-containing protein n=1 Tax=Paenibacillus foliorum TaxID=2654974 RepID=A0A972H1J3_9BACL|nr:histidine kinase [Paenibacillus foliorum]NOU94516.1 HAMP domain-containing protein [Paenibacillus foliorum]
MSMKLNWQNWRFSIFTKLLAMFFLVMVPVYALAMHMNDVGSGIVRNEISSSLQSQIHFYNNSLNKEIDRMIRLQREYVNDDGLVSLGVIAENLDYYERSSIMRQFQQKLNLMKSSGIYVTKASAYIPPIQRIVSTDELSDELPASVIDRLKRSRDRTGTSPLEYEDGRLFLREFYPSLPVSQQRDPIFVLETEVSVIQLQQFLQQISGFEQGGAAIVSSKWMIAGDTDQQVMKPIAQNVWEWVKSEQGNHNGIQTVRLNKQNYITAYEYAPETDTVLLVYVPEFEILGSLKKYKGFLMLMSLVTAILIVLVSLWVYQVIHKPLAKMVRAFRMVESGNLSISLYHRSRDEFSYMYKQFNEMTTKLRLLIYEVYEQKLQTQQAELNQLQSQINPHFLYNSLYLLYRMTKAQDYDNSLKFTKYLGDYFRYITKKTGDDVPLEQEWHHVRMYMEIQNIRFSNRLKVTISDLPEGLRSLMVPRLILQPLVENAYQHGLENTVTEGLLSVSIEADEKGMRIVTEDNGAGMSEEQFAAWRSRLASDKMNAEVSGIINVHRRLQLKFGADSGISLSPGSRGGLKVTMNIHFAEDKDKEEEHYAALNASR